MRMILILLYRVAFPRLSTMFLCLVWTLTLYTALYTVMYTVLYTVLYTDLFLQGLLQPHVEPLERPDLTWVKYKKKLLLKNISVVKIWPFLYLWLAVTFCTNSSIFQTVTLVSSKYIAWNKENLWRGRFQKFTLCKLVDFSVEWVDGIPLIANSPLSH